MRKLLLIYIVIFSMVSHVYAEEKEPERKFQGFNVQGFTKEGDKDWDVNGDTADIVGTEITISNVDGQRYGDQKMNVTAKTGVVDQFSGKMHLEEDVVITTDTGGQLITDSLDWIRDNDLVTTEDDVLITDKGITATGIGMNAHPEKKEVELLKDVTVIMDTQPDEPVSNVVTITCDGPMTMNQNKSIAVFNDNVVAVQEGQTLKADKMEIYFDIKESKIKEMICIGNVVIIKGENQTFAEKAIYDAATEKLTLLGRPKLILLTEGEDAITAP